MAKKVPLSVRLILWRGVIRRAYLYLFRRSYVNASIAKRKGECARCGVCCRLIADPCHALCRQGKESSCKIYNHFRMPNCVIFPIDHRDIADRNLVAPDIPCGYYWDEGKKEQK